MSLWTGVSFVLAPNSKNLTEFKSLDFVLDVSNGGTGCDLMVIDESGKRVSISFKDVNVTSNDITIKVDGQKYKINVPLATNFHDLDLKLVKEIGFSVGENYPRGNQKFIVSDVKLLRP
jgi:hypothetical protein